MNTKALYDISYGLYLVSSKMDDKLNGQIANTVIQVCSEPVKISVAINKNNYTHEFITGSKAFSVSILDKNTPLSFIGDFGFKCGRDVDKFKTINFKLTENGLPVVIDNTLSYLEARVLNEVDVGTHTLFIGELIGAEVLKEGEPMTYAYYHQVKRGTTPKSAPSYVEEKKDEKEEKTEMAKYKCKICGYIYDPAAGDPDNGVKPGTAFEDIPDDWVCPVCGAAKEDFEKI